MKRAAAVAVWVVAAACGGGEVPAGPDEPEVARRDSSGVEVVELSSAVLEALPVRWVSTTPATTIGVYEGADEEMFGRVADATALPGGSVVVADFQQGRLLVFGPEGAFRRALGRRGEGPGEFKRMMSLGAVGDTLFVADPGRGRTVAFLPDGRLVGEEPLLGGWCLPIDMDVYGPHGWTLTNACRFPEDGFRSEMEDPKAVLVVLSRMGPGGGRDLDTLRAAEVWSVTAESHDVLAEGEEARSSAFASHPFAPDLRATFVGDAPITGWTTRPEIRILTGDADLVRVVRLPVPTGDQPLPRDDRTREWAVASARLTERALARAAWRTLDPPDSALAFHALEAGREGAIWVATGPEETAPDAPLRTRWLRISVAGEPLEWVISPALDIIELGPEAILAHDPDELGVPRVSVYGYSGNDG